MIPAISRGCKGTLSDGVVRYVFDVEPKYAADAAKLFGMPGTSTVLAALTMDASIASAQASTIANENTPYMKGCFNQKTIPKGGALSKWAAMRCAESDFQKFIRPIYDKLMGGDGSGYGDVSPGNNFNGDHEAYARHCILVICNIDSRAELDTEETARAKFNVTIREPYIEWIKMRHENEVDPF